jgi:hypothetical protein
MPDIHGWPDPQKPGFPANPEKYGPHLLMDKSGKRRWYWWRASEGVWAGGRDGFSPFMAEQSWSYIGPAKTPDDLPL